MKNRSFASRLGFALGGIAHALRAERSFRTQVAAAAAVIVALLWLRPAPIWWAVTGLTSAAVLAVELMNTALEHLADHLHPEQHPSIKIVKDLGAAAVLVLSLGALFVAGALVWELS
jgi:undecaprenol kinase